MMLPLVAVLFSLAMPQAEPIDVAAQSNGRFAFDWNGEQADGTSMAETTDVEFHYVPVPSVSPGAGTGDGHITVKLPLVAVVGENVITMRLALADVPAGIYDLNVRLIGVGGLFSAYSTPFLSLRVRVKNPAPPTNVRVVGG